MPSLQFKGKSAVWNHHLSVPYHTLENDTKKSLKGNNDSENLIIEGDNLLALKALLPQYQGRVKCIYIDPPYNTGNEGWVYSDNVSSPTTRDWLGKTVGKVGEDMTRHDKWLCMMTPRLKLLRELLSDDGIIFVSIDDNEFSNLKQIMNEVFLEENFIGQTIWRKRPNPPNDSKFIGRIHEYILGYRKTDAIKNFEKMARFDFSAYSNPDDDPRGDWKATPLVLTETQARPNLTYEVVSPSGKKFLHKHGWRIEKKLFEELNKNNEIYWGEKNETSPTRKRFLSEDEGMLFNSIALSFGTTISARKEIKNLFSSLIFETPKPTKLIKALIEISTDKDSFVLDSFAGSGTTAHAILDLNKEDGGNRKFILVEMEDYADKITAERVRLASKKFEYDAGFTYYNLGPAIDAETLLSGTLPSYKEFAKYVYYLATGKNHPDEKKINETSSFVGKDDAESIYLVYQKDMDVLKKLAITLDWTQKIHEKDGGKKIVYAPACYLDDEALEQYNIKFVSIPYNLFERNA